VKITWPLENCKPRLARFLSPRRLEHWHW
jgi:hypothetical protein